MANTPNPRQGGQKQLQYMCCTVAVLYSSSRETGRIPFRVPEPETPATTPADVLSCREVHPRPVDAIAEHGSSAIPGDRTASRDHCGVSPDCIGHVHTFRILFFPAVWRLFYLIGADFVMIVVMVMGMFTGIFGKMAQSGWALEFTLQLAEQEIKLVVLGIQCCCAPCRAG